MRVIRKQTGAGTGHKNFLERKRLIPYVDEFYRFKPIAEIFRGHNRFEFKCPTDYVSVEDFYKGLAYSIIPIRNSDADAARSRPKSYHGGL
jgi:hypothetical protein